MSATPVQSSQPIGAHAPCTVVDVWLEAGRDGRIFTYGDYQQLGLSLGDLVVVRLRGRRLQGLVTASRPSSEDDLPFQTTCPWMLCSGQRWTPTGVTGSMPWRPSVTPVPSGCSKQPCHQAGRAAGEAPCLWPKAVVGCSSAGRRGASALLHPSASFAALSRSRWGWSLAARSFEPGVSCRDRAVPAQQGVCAPRAAARVGVWILQ